MPRPSNVVSNPPKGATRVAGWSYVTVAFGPPSNPLKTRAGVHHAVHWNKVREMLRPYAFQEVEGSAVVLGHGDGSVITFRTRGEPKLPDPVQKWLAETEPKGVAEASKIAKGGAKVVATIAKLFGVPQVGSIASGATVVLDALDNVLDPDDD